MSSPSKHQWAWNSTEHSLNCVGRPALRSTSIPDVSSSFVDSETSQASNTATRIDNHPCSDVAYICGICLSVPLVPAVIPQCNHLFCVPCLLEFLYPTLVKYVTSSGDGGDRSVGGDTCDTPSTITCPLDRRPIPIYSHALPNDLTFTADPPSISISTSSPPPQYLEPLLLKLLEWLDNANVGDAADTDKTPNPNVEPEIGCCDRTFPFSISVLVGSGDAINTKAVHLVAPKRDILRLWASHHVSCIHAASHGCKIKSIPLREFLITKHFNNCRNQPVYCPVKGCQYSYPTDTSGGHIGAVVEEDIRQVSSTCGGSDDSTNRNCFYSKEDLESHMQEFITTHFTIMTSQQSALATENTNLKRLVSDLRADSYQTRNDMAALEFQLREQSQRFQALLGSVHRDFVCLQQITSSLMLSQSMSPPVNTTQTASPSSLYSGTHMSYHNYSSLFNEMPCTLQSPSRTESTSSCGWWSQTDFSAPHTPFEVIDMNDGDQVCFRKGEASLYTPASGEVSHPLHTVPTPTIAGCEVLNCRGWATIKSHAMVVLEPTPSSSAISISPSNVVRIRFLKRGGHNAPISTTPLSSSSSSSIQRSQSAPTMTTAAGCGLAATRLMASSTSEALPLVLSDNELLHPRTPDSFSHLDSVFQSGAVMIGVMTSSSVSNGVVVDRHMGRISGCLAIQSTGFIWNGDTGLCRRYISLPSKTAAASTTSLEFSSDSEIYFRLKERPQLGCVLECAITITKDNTMTRGGDKIDRNGTIPPQSAFAPISFLSTTPRMLPLAISLGTSLVGVVVDFV